MATSINSGMNTKSAPPLITPTPSRRLFWPLGAILLAAGYVVILFFFNPSQHTFYPRCALFVSTGYYCPGCGSLRAMHQLVHGHVLTALRYNPLLILSLPVAALCVWRFTFNKMVGRPAQLFPLSTKWFWILAVIVVLFGIVRNIPCSPFIYLAPPV